MTNPTLERAARALADHFGCHWDTMTESDRETIRGYVRAVLMAVRSDMLDPKSGRVFDRSAASSLTAILAEDE